MEQLHERRAVDIFQPQNVSGDGTREPPPRHVAAVHQGVSPPSNLRGQAARQLSLTSNTIAQLSPVGIARHSAPFESEPSSWPSGQVGPAL
jgi:hypothetical protein